MPNLPVILALKHMLQLIANNWGVALRFCAPWLVLIAAVNAWQLISNPNANLTPENFKLDFKVVLAFIINLVATSSIAVSWHRHILIDEPQSQVKPFRIDSVVLAYLGKNILIIAATVVPLIILIVGATVFPSTLLPVWVGLSLVIIVFTVRVTVCLPATAIERPDFGLISAWTATRQNNFQILGLVLITSFIVIGCLVVMQILLALAHAIAPNLGIVAAVLLSAPFQFVVILLSTAMQTSLYGYFGEGRKF